MDFWKDFQTNWIDILATIRWQCWGGCAPEGRFAALEIVDDFAYHFYHFYEIYEKNSFFENEF